MNFRNIIRKLSPKKTIKSNNVTYIEKEKSDLHYCLYNPKGSGYKKYEVTFDDGFKMEITQTRERSYEDILGPTQLYQYEYIKPYLKGNETVLDCACGTGYGTKFLSKLCKMVYGLDIGRKNIFFARHKYNNLDFILGSANELPFSSNCFDVVVSVETIEHLQKDIEFVKEVYRILKKGGFFLVTTPHHGFNNPFHIREYRRDEFVDILRKYFEPNKWKWITDDGRWMELICVR